MRDSIKILLIVVGFVFLLNGCSSSHYTIVSKEKYNYTALHTAVRLNQTDIVKALVNKANINIKDIFGETPIVDAVRNDNIDISKILICNGADLTVTDENNLTLVDLAVRNNDKYIIEMLLHAKAFCANKYIIKLPSKKDKKETLYDMMQKRKAKTTQKVKAENEDDSSLSDELGLTEEDVNNSDNNTEQSTNKSVNNNAINVTVPVLSPSVVAASVDSSSTTTSNGTTKSQVQDDDMGENLTPQEMANYTQDDDIVPISSDLDEENTTSLDEDNISDNKVTDEPVEPDIKEIPMQDDTMSDIVTDLENITLPTNVTFDKSTLSFTFHKAGDLDTNLQHTLDKFIPDLLNVINNYQEDINEIKITNYTSSEYRSLKSQEAKRKANLKLSQKRAADIKAYINKLAMVYEYDAIWLDSVLKDIGKGSTDPILKPDGTEDQSESKRTILTIILN